MLIAPYNRGDTMNKVVSNALKGGTIALALLMAAGCQSGKELEEVRAVAQRADQNATAAQKSADAASAAASSANASAAAAKSAADSAQSTANRALQAAQAAQASVDAQNEKMDRMFKKSVSK
jgi:methyl-accepting chemotaxis protein